MTPQKGQELRRVAVKGDDDDEEKGRNSDTEKLLTGSDGAETEDDAAGDKAERQERKNRVVWRLFSFAAEDKLLVVVVRLCSYPPAFRVSACVRSLTHAHTLPGSGVHLGQQRA